MFVHKGRYLKSDAIVAWWPQGVEDVTPFLDQASVVVLWQCPESLLPPLRTWTFQYVPFHTPLIALALPEDELWRGLDPKSCRYEIRKAQQMDCAISLNEKTEAARTLINDSIRRLKYRDELSDAEWAAILPDHDIFLCRWQGIPIAAHVILRDRPRRARLLLSGTADRTNDRLRSVLGPCNRLLHWHELRYYKAEGYGFYDFGGCDLDKKSPTHLISRFKLSFGGQVVAEPRVYLAKSPALRAVLRARGVARSALRQIPWPAAWLNALRARPKLASWLR